MPPLPESTPAQATPERDRLPFREKSAYGLGTSIEMWGFWLYPGVAYAVFNIYLKVDPVLIGFALMFMRIYDAFADPICGWISDNTRSRWGRRRPFILLAGIMAGVCLPLMFMCPESWAGKGFDIDLGFWSVRLDYIFLWMIGTNMIYLPVVSAFSMPFNSLSNEMTPDYNERTSIMTYRSAMQKIFEIGNFYALKFTNLFVITAPAIAGSVTANAQKNTLMGIRYYTCILGAIMICAAVYMFFNLKERYYENVASKQKKFSIWTSMKQTLGCKPYRIMLWFGISFSVANSMVGALGYYCTVYYVCAGDTVSGDNWNFYMSIGYMVLGFSGPPVFNLVANKFGKVNAIITASVVGILSFAGTWVLYTPTAPGLTGIVLGIADLTHIPNAVMAVYNWFANLFGGIGLTPADLAAWHESFNAGPFLQILASGMIAFSCAAIWMLHSAIGADIIDFDELNTGTRREGGFASFMSWILKFGNSIGMLMGGVILSWSGFDANLSVQSEDTVFWIRASLAFIPVFGLLAAIGFAMTFPLTKKRVLEIRQELEARRGSV
ncbi:MAG: MFS transporter [Opitutales bacterium]|nr:MFS transporter [Opitutales bacterium]